MPLNQRSFEIHLQVIWNVSDRLQMLDLVWQVVVYVNGSKVSQVLFNRNVQEQVTDLGFLIHTGGVFFEQVLILFFEPGHIGQEKDEVKDVVPIIILALTTVFEKLHVILIDECVNIFVDVIPMVFVII